MQPVAKIPNARKPRYVAEAVNEVDEQLFLVFMAQGRILVLKDQADVLDELNAIPKKCGSIPPRPNLRRQPLQPFSHEGGVRAFGSVGWLQPQLSLSRIRAVTPYGGEEVMRVLKRAVIESGFQLDASRRVYAQYSGCLSNSGGALAREQSDGTKIYVVLQPGYFDAVVFKLRRDDHGVAPFLTRFRIPEFR